ncbi:hypothetical protein LJK88_26610 [Paenibacillus sp. P26]|nr:hypothetical protein LJK88_26610 [Paenibacillus sp. P26]UUZ95048.1 hypothetical protein LJK87_11390 [Paenibacillus sp. P25]
MKKTMGLALACVMTAGILPGCGGESAADGKTADQPGSGGKLKFTMSMTTSGNKVAEKTADINQEKWVKKLEEVTHTDITFRMFPLKDFDQKMSLMFAAGDIPDVVQNVGAPRPKVCPAPWKRECSCRLMICSSSTRRRL